MYLVGNRVDIEDEREVSTEEGQKEEISKGYGNFFETSAKTG